MRRFALYRHEDASGVSGTGHVADGVQFPNGWCSLCWRTPHTSLAMYPSIGEVKAIHGHDGRTEILWPDEICTASYIERDGQRLSCGGVPGHRGDHLNPDTGFAFARGVGVKPEISWAIAWPQQ